MAEGLRSQGRKVMGEKVFSAQMSFGTGVFGLIPSPRRISAPEEELNFEEDDELMMRFSFPPIIGFGQSWSLNMSSVGGDKIGDELLRGRKN